MRYRIRRAWEALLKVAMAVFWTFYGPDFSAKNRYGRKDEQ